MPRRALRSLTAVATIAGCTAGIASVATADPGPSVPAALSARVIAAGATLSHPVGTTTEPLTGPDDLVNLGKDVFVDFQNGVGSMGEPSSAGNTASTIVEMTTDGTIVNQWDVGGKIDGMGVDRQGGQVLATVNEDGNSSVYRLDPSAGPNGTLTHYAYDQNPLPHGGGTDAISVVNGTILVSASAPTPAPANVPAVYAVTLHDPSTPTGTGVADVRGVFSDTASATPINPGAPSQLGLTDPDSNTVVPQALPRLGGDFMLDSQGDQQEIFVTNPASASPQLSVLALSQSVDDSAFATSSSGELITTDSSANTVDVISGGLQPNQPYTSITPCGANTAPSNCSTPDSLGTINLQSGAVTPVNVAGIHVQPKGLIFVGTSDLGGQGGQGRGDQGQDQGGHGQWSQGQGDQGRSGQG